MMYFQHFQSKEFFPNCTADEIAQCVNSNFFDNLLTLLHALDIIRDIVNMPIIITSSYRDKFHNKRVGGVPTSQHMTGSAIDFMCPSLDFECFQFNVRDILHKEPALNDVIGQCIIYHKRKFIHIGLRTQSFKHLTIYHYEQGKS